MKKVFMGLFLLVSLTQISVPAYATNAWYAGKVSRVALIGSGFIVTFKNNALQNCKHNYAYFTIGNLDELRVKQAYSMALTSLTKSKGSDSIDLTK